jgi:DNA-binding beta-propeller fold protein YncE
MLQIMIGVENMLIIFIILISISNSSQSLRGFNVTSTTDSTTSDRRQLDGCMGPPYIYMTLHDANNIYKYSRDGCLLDDQVLDYVSAVKHDYPELRSMAFGKYYGDDVLYVADATSGDSRLLIYSRCDDRGRRAYITTAVSSQDYDGVDHTYGITFDNHDNVYISNQHTDNVLRFYKDSFKAMPLPPVLATDSSRNYYYKGTYKQFGSPAMHSAKEQGVRSIIIVHNELWIANEDFDGVIMVDLPTGLSLNVVMVSKPIGLYYDPDTQLIFVSSKGKHRQGSVVAIDRRTLRVVRRYKEDRMEHPTGLFVHNKILYVAEQIESAILAFDIESTEFLGKIIKHIPGDVEHIVLSDC